MMTGIHAFPKVHTLGTRYIDSIFNGEVEITEKVDGSQLVFGRINGELKLRSKGAELWADHPQKMFREGIEVIRNLALPENTIFYCEYLQKPRHNSLKYNKIPRNHLMLFGASDQSHTFYKYKALEELARQFDIDVAPLLFMGETKAENILDFLELESYLGGPKIEGVVVKNYKEYLLADIVVPIMVGKYVSEKFKEIHRKNWSGSSKDRWEHYKESFRVEARWEKAVQYLRDSGVLLGEPKDIGALIKRVHEDINEEEKDNIKEFLWSHFGSDLLRKSTAGLPEWYKSKLLSSDLFPENDK